MLRDTHYYALALSQLTARECGVRCGVPFPACPQTRQARWLAAKERSNARVSPDHGSEGEDVQLRWRPAHEENSDEFPAIKISRSRSDRTERPPPGCRRQAQLAQHRWRSLYWLSYSKGELLSSSTSQPQHREQPYRRHHHTASCMHMHMSLHSTTWC